MNSENKDLITEYDINEAERTIEYEKYRKYYDEHPEREKKDGPKSLNLSIDPKAASMHKIVKQYVERESLKEKKVVKKTKKVPLLDAKKIALVGITGLSIAAVSCLGYVCAREYMKHVEREDQFEQAVEYMNDNIMPDVLTESGFTVAALDENENYIYNYDNANILKAHSILIDEYGFTNESSELAIAKYFNYDDTIYILRGQSNSDNYYEACGYHAMDNWDKGFDNPTKIFENMNQIAYTRTVNDIIETRSVEGGRDARG